jgi:hypothetical protein
MPDGSYPAELITRVPAMTAETDATPALLPAAAASEYATPGSADGGVRAGG